jgi:Helix-turn-helix domain/Domain of unknown function (DUF4115)
VSIGEVLTAARSQAGLTITQVSQQTRIRETIVRGIEADDFSACGADFYARGHIRAIAASVGADPEPLVREYDSRHSLPQAPASGPGLSAPSQLTQRHRPRWGIVLLVVLAAVAGLVTYLIVASGPGSSLAGDRKQAAIAPKAARKHPAVQNTSAPPGATHASPVVVISLTAVSEPCWADLTTPGGATIFQGVVDPGTSKTWTQQQAVTLKLGNPGAVTLTVDGKTRTGLGSNPVTLSLRPRQGSPG